jgi:DNA-binding MarR family transcriptional regulator
MSDALLLKNQLCFPLYAASRRIVAAYTPYLRPLKLTYPQYIVMMVLWEKDHETVGEIGKKVHLDNGTLTPVIRNLTRNGYVTRKRSETDERVVIVSLTEEGKKLKQKAEEIPGKMAGFLKLSKEEAGELYRLLYRILDDQA